MKKQLFFPVLIAVFAVGSAFASIKMAPGYYEGNDSDCNGTVSFTPQCPIGDQADCLDDNFQPHYTKPNSDLPTDEQTNPCTVLRRQIL